MAESKLKKSKKALPVEKEYTNVFNYNEGDRRMEDYFDQHLKIHIDVEILRSYHS